MQIKARFIGGGRHIGTTLLGYRPVAGRHTA
jgi:hypothetical protein